MKTLRESLLGDEEDMINNEAAAAEVIETWCDKHLVNWKKFGGYIKNGKVNISYVAYGDTVVMDLGTEGIIPDYIKWGNTSGARFLSLDRPKSVIKSFKNFPIKFGQFNFYNKFKSLPSDFTSWPGNIQCDQLQFKNIKTLKGLKGNIKELAIYADELIEFNCSNLVTDTLLCRWINDYKLKSFDNLPKINDMIELTFNNVALKRATQANIKKPNKITWNNMIAPGFIYDILNK